MSTLRIKELPHYIGQRVIVDGWLYNKRTSGKVQFPIVRDGSGYLQCVVVKKDVGEETWDAVERVTQESTVRVVGIVRAEPRAAGGVELGVQSFEIMALTEDYPITPKEHGTAFLMDIRHLWLRSSKQHAVLKIRSELQQACRDFFYERDFTLIDSPILTPAACEGTSTLFETDYFGEKAFLSQSGQLYLEPAAAAFGRVYCFGPTFRAEKSKTRRHLTEFWMVEPEVAYMDLDGDMALMEEFVSHVVGTALGKHERELAGVLERDVSRLRQVKPPFPRITYGEAVEVIRSAQRALAAEGKRDPAAPLMAWGEDIGGDEETLVAGGFDRPVMVHRYPAQLKAFYFKKDPADPKVALGCDVLAPEGYGEIIGGGQREDDLAVLETAIAEHRLPAESFEWYLDLRRYGSVPHAGFGMGVERCVAWVCGLHHVRETIPFARMMERITP